MGGKRRAQTVDATEVIFRKNPSTGKFLKHKVSQSEKAQGCTY